MLWTFILMSAIYYLFLIFLIRSWNKKTPVSDKQEAAESPFVSVIIAVRNEEETIGCLLDGLAHQDYPAERFEVIVMDDGSMDSTLEVVQVKGRHLPCELKMGVTGVDQLKGTGKKTAIAEGIELAAGELILITDGDCRVGIQWISAMVNSFLSRGADFLAGPVRLKNGTGFWHQWQVLEFASLTGTGAAFIQSGQPLFCNGANMAFRKKVFYSLGGYSGNERFASGDDVFLMKKIHTSGGKVVFVKNRKAIVETKPLPAWRDFFHQRNRWAGKWHRHQSALSLLVPVFLFAYYLLMLATLTLVVMGSFTWWILLLLLVIKVVFDYLFLRNVMIFLENMLNISIFVVSSLGYFLYAVFFGITANLMGFHWKGRKHKR